MKGFLFDTSIVIDFLRRKDKEASLVDKLSRHALFISIVTHTELFAGKSAWESEKTRKAIVAFFSQVTILPLTDNISETAGYIKAYKQSNAIIDSIIAATAIEHNLELVTLNVKDFERIEKVKIYQSEI